MTTHTLDIRIPPFAIPRHCDPGLDPGEAIQPLKDRLPRRTFSPPRNDDEREDFSVISVRSVVK